jgi:SAM-dependent methyltransferase
MDLEEQGSLGQAADRHWYYRAKSAAMLRLLEGTPYDDVLDVGAGSGFFSRALLAQTSCRSAVCVDPNYPKEWTETEAGKPLHFVRSVDHFCGHLALMMDVLEHVADDIWLLRDTAAKMQPGSRILITVPAMPWMWSDHDVFLEHYRRYTIGSLDRVIEAAGLKRIAICYYFGLTLPMAAGVRLGRRALPWRNRTPGSDMRPYPGFINSVLTIICKVELGLFQKNRLAGLSVFALVEV